MRLCCDWTLAKSKIYNTKFFLVLCLFFVEPFRRKAGVGLNQKCPKINNPRGFFGISFPLKKKQTYIPESRTYFPGAHQAFVRHRGLSPVIVHPAAPNLAGPHLILFSSKNPQKRQKKRELLRIVSNIQQKPLNSLHLRRELPNDS